MNNGKTKRHYLRQFQTSVFCNDQEHRKWSPQQAAGCWYKRRLLSLIKQLASIMSGYNVPEVKCSVLSRDRSTYSGKTIRSGSLNPCKLSPGSKRKYSTVHYRHAGKRVKLGTASRKYILRCGGEINRQYRGPRTNRELVFLQCWNDVFTSLILLA